MEQKSFRVGDRVCQRGFAFMGEGYRFGEIVEVYSSVPNGRNESDAMYAVRWDGAGQTTRGYLGVGLEHYFPLPPILLPGVK